MGFLRAKWNCPAWVTKFLAETTAWVKTWWLDDGSCGLDPHAQVAL